MLYVCYAGTFFWFTWLQRQRVQPPKFTTTNCGAYLSVQTVVFCCQREGRRNLVRFQHRTLGGALSGRSESCPRSVSVHVWVGEKPVHTPSAPSVIGFSVSSHTYTFLALIRHICPGRLARVSDSRLRIRKRHSTKPCGVSLNGCPSGQSLKRIRPPGGGGWLRVILHQPCCGSQYGNNAGKLWSSSNAWSVWGPGGKKRIEWSCG